MKDLGAESRLNAELRELTLELRQLREKLRRSLHEVPHSPRQTLEEHFRRARRRNHIPEAPPGE